MLLVLEVVKHFLFTNNFVTFEVCGFLYMICWLMLTIGSIYAFLTDMRTVCCKVLTFLAIHKDLFKSVSGTLCQPPAMDYLQ